MEAGRSQRRVSVLRGRAEKPAVAPGCGIGSRCRGEARTGSRSTYTHFLVFLFFLTSLSPGCESALIA